MIIYFTTLNGDNYFINLNNVDYIHIENNGIINIKFNKPDNIITIENTFYKRFFNNNKNCDSINIKSKSDNKITFEKIFIIDYKIFAENDLTDKDFLKNLINK